jgi:hypothetical protein
VDLEASSERYSLEAEMKRRSMGMKNRFSDVVGFISRA